MRTLLLLTCAALALAFAPAPLPKPERGRDPSEADLRRIQGTWKVLSYSVNGNHGVAGNTMVVSGRRVTLRLGDSVLGVCALALDARSGLFQQTPDGGVPEQNTYRLEGDELTVAWLHADRTKGRPQDVEPGPGRTVFVYRRVRP